MTSPSVRLYTGKALQECVVCSSVAYYEAEGVGGRYHACVDLLHLSAAEQIANLPPGGTLELDTVVARANAAPPVLTEPAAPVRPKPVRSLDPRDDPSPRRRNDDVLPVPGEYDEPATLLRIAANRWEATARAHDDAGHSRKAKDCRKLVGRIRAVLANLELIEQATSTLTSEGPTWH